MQFKSTIFKKTRRIGHHLGRRDNYICRMFCVILDEPIGQGHWADVVLMLSQVRNYGGSTSNYKKWFVGMYTHSTKHRYMAKVVRTQHARGV